MITKHDIIALVGEARYAQESDIARSLAPYTGSNDRSKLYDSELPFTIFSLIWDDHGDDQDKIHAVMQIYRDIPCYALLTNIYLHYYRSFQSPTKSSYFSHLKELYVEEPHCYAPPINYTLAMDFFDDPRYSTEAWRYMTDNETQSVILHGMLRLAASVEYDEKEKLYQRLVSNESFHADICYSLWTSCFFSLGTINKSKALQLLRRLRGVHQSTEYNALYDALNSPKPPTAGRTPKTCR